jgi:hypothetical protein
MYSCRAAAPTHAAGASRRHYVVTNQRELEQAVERVFDLLVSYRGTLAGARDAVLSAAKWDPSLHRDLEQDAERVFDLLVSGAVRNGAESDRSLSRIEGDLRRLLPRLVAACRNELLGRISAVIGNRDEADRLLAGVDVWQLRAACLDTIAAGEDEPWLPIDEAARQAGWRCNRMGRCDQARRAATWKRQEPLPTRKVGGKLCARVSDCARWKPLAEESAAAFGRSGASKK